MKKGKKNKDPIVRNFGRGANAYVVFDDEQSVERALNLRKRKRFWKILDMALKRDSSTGLMRYWELYQIERPSSQILQDEVDKYMEIFDETRKKAQEAIEAASQLPDEDGFVKVVRTGRRRHVNRQGDLTVTAASAAVTRKLASQEKTISNFYRFQVRQAKEQQLKELKRKFEEDKRKIALLKASRHFRPF